MVTEYILFKHFLLQQIIKELYIKLLVNNTRSFLFHHKASKHIIVIICFNQTYKYKDEKFEGWFF